MLFFSQEFKHKIKLKLVSLKIWWFLEPIYRFSWKRWVNAGTDDFSTSPLVIAEMVKEIIKDKKVCDLGCRKGFLLSAFKKYAKEVVGVEKDENFCEICRKKGLNVINGDIFEIKIPDADVYYFWLNEKQVREIMKRFKEQSRGGLVIRGFRADEPQIFESPIISCPRRRSTETDFKIQIIKL
jgi:SAM-dependent methyltransferase